MDRGGYSADWNFIRPNRIQNTDKSASDALRQDLSDGVSKLPALPNRTKPTRSRTGIQRGAFMVESITIRTAPRRCESRSWTCRPINDMGYRTIPRNLVRMVMPGLLELEPPPGPPNAADKRTAPRRAGGTTVARPGRSGGRAACRRWPGAPAPATSSFEHRINSRVPASGVTAA